MLEIAVRGPCRDFSLKRDKVIASAQNRVGNRSKGSGYSDFTIHAERAVVKKLGDISQLRHGGATLCVWRVSSFRVMPSAPCNDCRIFLERCMREYGMPFLILMQI